MTRRILENLLASASLPDAHGSAELLLSRYHTLDGVFCADASDLTDLLDAAVRNRAKSVIIAHNHPAGRATPSSEDMAFTDAAEKLLCEIGIRLRAHYVVAGNQCRKID